MNSGRLVPDPVIHGAWLVRVDGIDQSFVDPRDPARLEFDYMRRMGDHVDLQAPPGQRLRVVHLGGAGMSLARYIAHTRPTSAQIVVEPDAQLTAEVRAVIPLPPRSGIKVRARPGRESLSEMPDDYADVIIADAFTGGTIPADMVTWEFYAQVRRVLRPDGLLLANLADQRPFDWARRVIAGIAAHFPQVIVGAASATLKKRRFGNLVCAASAREHPCADLEKRSCAMPFPYCSITGEGIAGFVAGAIPFVDADTRPSDPPSERLTWYG